jgi:putative membrane protein
MYRNRNTIVLGSFVLAALVVSFGCSSARDSSKFAVAAAQGGLTEVELGKLALRNAADPSVREFGMRMVSDHSHANEELKAIAGQKKIQLPAEVSSSQKSTIEKLSKLTGAEFDKAYMADMVTDHEEDVAEFQTQSKDGNTEEIKAFAGKTLPTLQSHLEMAREVAKKVGAR